MMTSSSVAASMTPMKENFHKIVKIPSKAATDFAKRFGFYDHGGFNFRLPLEDDTAEGPSKDDALPFHTIDFSQGVFRPCKSPPYKKLLDRLLDDNTIDRSVAHLLGYK